MLQELTRRGKLKIAKSDESLTIIIEQTGPDSGIGIHRYASGGVYIGELREGRFHGIGELKANHRVYKGTFQEGQMVGIGLQKSKRSTYTGFFKKEKKHGLGIHQTADQSQDIKGYFYSGEPRGFCVVSHNRGDVVLSGNFEKNVLQGVGLEENSQLSYLGEFEQNRKHGTGLIKSKDGSSYQGGWDHDQHSGFGIEKLESGEIYYGSFEKGLRHGYGKVQDEDSGLNYLGKFNKGSRTGFGKIDFGRGFYLGNFVEGERNGMGYQKIGSSEVYLGCWKANKRNGVGIDTNDQREYLGEWVEDLPHGRAVVTVSGSQKKAALFKEGNLSEVLEDEMIGQLETEFNSLNFGEFLESAPNTVKSIESFIEKSANDLEKQMLNIRESHSLSMSKLNRDTNKLIKDIEILMNSISSINNQIASEFDQEGLDLRELATAPFYSLEDLLRPESFEERIDRKSKNIKRAPEGQKISRATNRDGQMQEENLTSPSGKIKLDKREFMPEDMNNDDDEMEQDNFRSAGRKEPNNGGLKKRDKSQDLNKDRERSRDVDRQPRKKTLAVPEKRGINKPSRSKSRQDNEADGYAIRRAPSKYNPNTLKSMKEKELIKEKRNELHKREMELDSKRLELEQMRNEIESERKKLIDDRQRGREKERDEYLERESQSKSSSASTRDKPKPKIVLSSFPIADSIIEEEKEEKNKLQSSDRSQKDPTTLSENPLPSPKLENLTEIEIPERKRYESQSSNRSDGPKSPTGDTPLFMSTVKKQEDKSQPKPYRLDGEDYGLPGSKITEDQNDNQYAQQSIEDEEMKKRVEEYENTMKQLQSDLLKIVLERDEYKEKLAQVEADKVSQPSDQQLDKDEQKVVNEIDKTEENIKERNDKKDRYQTVTDALLGTFVEDKPKQEKGNKPKEMPKLTINAPQENEKARERSDSKDSIGSKRGKKAEEVNVKDIVQEAEPQEPPLNSETYDENEPAEEEPKMTTSYEDFIRDSADFEFLLGAGKEYKKLEIDEKGNTICLGGFKSLVFVKYSAKSKQYKTVNQVQKLPCTDLKTVKRNIFVQKGGKNDLIVFGGDFKQISATGGFEEKTSSLET